MEFRIFVTRILGTILFLLGVAMVFFSNSGPNPLMTWFSGILVMVVGATVATMVSKVGRVVASVFTVRFTKKDS